VPDVKVTAGVLRPWIRTVLREPSETIQGTVAQAMTISVTGGERKSVRSALGQRDLQAVVIRTGIVRHLIDKPKERKLSKERPGFLGGLWVRLAVVYSRICTHGADGCRRSNGEGSIGSACVGRLLWRERVQTIS
jgi:hypothetical protein